jgi:hypothetical protein
MTRRELIFMEGRKMMSVEVQNGEFASPRLLSTVPPDIVTGDAMADGSRFLATKVEKVEPPPITLVTNWTRKMKK